MSQTWCGVSAKKLQLDLGVTYKTAWRMFHRIRTMLSDDDELLSGKVEADENYGGGDRRHAGTRGGRPAEGTGKTPAHGAVEHGGSLRAVTVPNVKADTLLPVITARVPVDDVDGRVLSRRRSSIVGSGQKRIPTRREGAS